MWARLRNPVDLESNVWVNTAAIEADQKMDDLPVVECDDPTANPDLLSEMTMGGTAATTTVPSSDESVPDTAVPDTAVPDDSASTTQPAPGVTTTAPEPSPTTTRPGGPTTTTTQKPLDKSGPSVTNVGASPKDVWTYDQYGVCDPATTPKKVSVTARATDPSGVSSARFQWSVNGKSDNVNMTRSGATWTGTATFPYETLPDHGDGMNQTVTVRLYATDGAGNVTQRTTSFTLHSSAQCLG